MMMASVSTVTILILLLGLSLLFYNNVKKLRGAIASQMEIHAYLKGNPLDSEVLALHSRIASLPAVQSIRYIPKEQTLEELRKTLKDSINLSGIMNNPLPSYFSIVVNDPKNIESTAQTIQSMPGIDRVNYLQKAAEQLVSFFRMAENFLFGLVAFLFFGSFLIIYQTIHLGVSSRKKEIEIMELVGASPGIIRWPFLLEGAFYGLLGAILAISLLKPGYELFLRKIQDFFFSRGFMAGKDLWLLLVELIVTGATVGAYGSYRAVNRYLKC